MTLIPKPEKDITTKLQTNVPYEYRYKIPQQNTEGGKKKKKRPGLEQNPYPYP